MASNNFLVFNQNKQNMISDAIYQGLQYRLNGVTPGIAPSANHNKMFYQWSMMCAAFGQFVANAGFDASDADLALLTNNITQALLSFTGSSALFWQPNMTYTAGDIVYSKTLGMAKWFYCTQGGISGATEPTWAADGETTADNTVRWVTYPGGTARDSVQVGGQTLQQIITQIIQQIPANAVSILTGVITNGGVIPLPYGYTQAQCYWFVIPRYIVSRSVDTTIITNCAADGNRYVTLTSETSSGECTATYVIIGVK